MRSRRASCAGSPRRLAVVRCRRPMGRQDAPMCPREAPAFRWRSAARFDSGRSARDHHSPVPAPGAPPIWLTVYLRESPRLSPTAEPSRCKRGPALTSRSLAAERDRQVNLRKQTAVSTAPAYRKSDDVAVLFARARAFHNFGQLALAQVGYTKVLKKRPNHFEALHMLGASEHQNGDSEAALRLLKRALLLDPLSAPVQCDLGIVLAALRRHDEALACFGKLITMQADFVEPHFHQGNVLLGLGRLAEAIVSFDNAIALDSQHVNALTNKGHALHLLGRFAEAIMCYDKVLMVKPAHVPALINRGAAFKELRHAERAIAEFNLALAIEPDCTVAWINRGETLLVLGRLDEALASFDRVLSIDAEQSLAWLGRANMLMRAARVPDALAACQRAIAIEPASVKALTQIGQCMVAIRADGSSWATYPPNSGVV